MVVGELRPEPLLEAGSLAFHAAVMRKNPAVVPGTSLRRGMARSTDRITQIPVAPHDRFDPVGTLLLREGLFPAEDATCPAGQGALKQHPHHRSGGKNKIWLCS